MASIGIIGGGNMANVLIKGMESLGMKDILVSEPREVRRQYLKHHHGIQTTDSNKEAVSSCRIIILAVKPQDMEAVLDEIYSTVTEDKTVISIAAGVTLSYLSSRLKTKNIIRAMPNTPALVREGMTVISIPESSLESDISIAKKIFSSIGKLLVLPEEHMDAVTALSGSGPAFFALFIESMIQAGVKMGLDEKNSLALAVQTAVGTSQLLLSGMSPTAVREMVTSPGGTTAEGLRAFEEKGFKDMVSAALNAAKERSKQLGMSE